MHDGSDGIEEGKLGFAGQCLDGARQRRRGEGPGRHDDAVPIGGRQARDLTPGDVNERMRFERRRHLRREAVAIDCQRAPGRQLVGVGGRHDQRGGAAHLLVEQPDRIGLPFVRAERVRAHKFGERPGLMRFGLAVGPHLVEHGRHAATRELPGRLAACQSTPDDVNFARHG